MWCQATGNAHHSSEPSKACPAARGRMFRWRTNIQAIAVPPINVAGTSTGFGQCKAAKIAPATELASQRLSMSDASRFVKKELSATCCIRQNAKYANILPNERKLGGGITAWPSSG